MSESDGHDSTSWRDLSRPALPPLLKAAADCFVESGYHGTTIRTIAARAGLSVPGYYHHYESKHAILVEIMRFAMDDLWERSRAADRDSAQSPEERLARHVECLVLFHAHRADLAFIASSEIRALQAKAHAEHISRRDRQQELFTRIVSEGVAEGVFDVVRPRDTVRALITMCTGVAQWFREGGALSAEELADLYVENARRMLGSPNQETNDLEQR